MKLTLFLAAAALTACSPSRHDPEINTNLSTVTVGKFQAKQGYKDWKSMKILVNDATTGASRLTKDAKVEDYTAGTNKIDMRLKYGSYTFILEYYDADGSTLLYRSCKNKDGQDTSHTINSPSVNLRIEVCATQAAGANPGDGGGSTGESNVSITPVFTEGS